MPTASPARPCARSRAACGRSTCSTTRFWWRCCRPLVMLVGSTILLGWHWPMMGLIIAAGSLIFIAQTVLLSLGFVAPAASLANAWDTRLGGALADAVSCNSVVKAFGAEEREEARLAKVVAKWRHRTARTWTRGTINGTVAERHPCPAARRDHRLCAPSVVERAGECGRHRLRADLVLPAAGLSARCRHAHPQPAALGQRHGGTGRHPGPAARRRRPARRQADPDRRRRHRVRPRRRSTMAAIRGRSTATSRCPSARASASAWSGIRARARRPSSSSSSGSTTSAAAGSLIDGQDIAKAHAGVAARADRHRPAGADPVPPLAGREHRLCPARRHPGRDRARGEARQRARLHPAAAQGLRHAGRRARRQAVGRRAPARGDRTGLPCGCADPDPRRGDVEPRFGIGGADPAGDGAADGRSHHADHRPPAVDRARARPAAGLRPRQDRRRGHATRRWSVSTAASIAGCSSGRRWNSPRGSPETLMRHAFSRRISPFEAAVSLGWLPMEPGIIYF